MSRHYWLQAGYDYELNSDFTLQPSALVKSDANSTQLDLTATELYNKMVWLGVTYRTEDAIAAMIGYQRAVGNPDRNPGMIRIGYSYDMTTSELKNYSSGSHELMVNYCFNLVPRVFDFRYK